MEYNAAKEIMNTKLSTFCFQDYDGRNKAAGLIHNNCGGSDAYEEHSWDGEYYIDIYSYCTDVPLAVQYCQANGGKRVD